MTLKLQEAANFGMFFHVMQTFYFLHVCVEKKMRTRLFCIGSMGWIAAKKKPGKTAKQWCDICDAQVAAHVTERECFYWPEEYEIVCRFGFVNVNIVFLICLMFIFERPIQISLFRIHLVSVIKCVTCQVGFWINYWRAWMDSINGDKRAQFKCWTEEIIGTILLVVQYNAKKRRK